MRLDFAAFLELEAFSRLGTRLEPAAQRRLDIGRRVRRLLRAPRGQPLPLFDEVVRLILSSEAELLLRLPEGDVEDTTNSLVARLRPRLATLSARVERDAVLSEAERRAIAVGLERLLDARPPSEADDGSARSAAGADA
jgi:F-type H+-transporting ATPase subunit alpha